MSFERRFPFWRGWAVIAWCWVLIGCETLGLPTPQGEPAARVVTISVPSTLPAALPPTRLVVIGDSTVSLWQDDLATALAAQGHIWGRPLTGVVLLGEEGKLPCYFDPAVIQPGDTVLVGFVASRWHRVTSPECNPDLAPTLFHDWLAVLVDGIKAKGGTVYTVTPPRNQSDTNFGGELWWPGLTPAEIVTTIAGTVFGQECRVTEMLRPDGYHTAPEGEQAFGVCLATALQVGTATSPP